MSGAQNWQANGANGLYGTLTSLGNGGGTVTARSELDYRRLGSPGKTPEAQYPDGYISSINDRRSDRLLSKMRRMDARPYSRGVHAGERINPGDYTWPDNWNMKTGVKAQARGLRTPLAADGPEPRLVHGGNQFPAIDPTGPVGSDAHRVSQLAGLLPPWT